jgi:hypothetical protein
VSSFPPSRGAGFTFISIKHITEEYQQAPIAERMMMVMMMVQTMMICVATERPRS